MEIVHITSEKGWRGGEYQLFYLILELTRKEIRNTLVVPEGSAIEAKLLDEKKQHLQIINLPVHRPYNPVTWLRLKSIIRSRTRPIVHLHTPDAHTLAYLSPFSSKIPMLLDRRTMFPIKSNILTQKKYNSDRIRRIICCSNTIADYVAKAVKNPQKIITIYDGVNLDGYIPGHHSSRDDILKELALPVDCKLVGNASALTHEKGWEDFIEIAAAIIKNDNTVHFLIIGDGPMRDDLTSQVEQLGVTTNVHFLGFRNDALSLIAGLNCLLMPSKTEGLGTVIMEAFMVNTPVVATRAGGVQELVIDEQTGLISDIGDNNQLIYNTLRVLQDRNLASALTKNAANHLLHFSVTSMAQKTLEVYKLFE